ncbi:MAG: response regulator [Dehalococcoidia bacterium]|nr:response regulator [Dehalococcoidia bacterium]
MNEQIERGKILIVDDERAVRTAINKRLTRAGHRCIEAGEVNGLIEKIREDQPHLVILDIKMPGKQGNEILPEIISTFPGTSVVMATAVVDPGVIVECIRNGAQDYIMKPFDLEYVTQIVDKTLQKRKLEQDIKRFQESLEAEVEHQRKETQKLFLNSIESLVFALEAKDKYTAGHSRRVASIAVAIAGEMGLEGDEMDNIRLGALLHDTGKIAVAHDIMNKPGQLTEDEYRHVMAHASIGAGIVKPVVNQQILDIIIHHHDFYNGKGYDQNISGDRVPLGARIIAVADSYDAMTSDRPYRSALTGEQGMNEIMRCSGTQFDPAVASAFQRVYLAGIIKSKGIHTKAIHRNTQPLNLTDEQAAAIRS